MDGILVNEMPDWRDRVRAIEEKDPAFTTRFATMFEKKKQSEYESGIYDPALLEYSHAHGFLAESACAYNLNNENISHYISDYDYHKLWPLNSWQRIWINDKLTLRFVLGGTKWEALLPDYYFYTERGTVRSLPNAGYQSSLSGLIACLQENRELASKPCNGALSQGFHKLGYDLECGAVSVDDDKLHGESELQDFVEAHQNYVITEYIRPVDYLSAIHPLIHTLRVLVARIDDSFELLAAYLRFGSASSQGNYIIPGADASNYTVGVDVKTGAFGNGKLIYANRVEEIAFHPGTGVLAEGVLHEWETVKLSALGVAEELGFIDYMGFDFGITDKGVRVMEINSYPGLKYIQMFNPVYETQPMSRFFGEKLRLLDELDDDALRKRRGISR